MQWDTVMETTEMAVSLAVTSSNPVITVKVYSSLNETPLGMKENNFLPGIIHLPSKHASHLLFEKLYFVDIS